VHVLLRTVGVRVTINVRGVQRRVLVRGRVYFGIMFGSYTVDSGSRLLLVYETTSRRTARGRGVEAWLYKTHLYPDIWGGVPSSWAIRTELRERKKYLMNLMTTHGKNKNAADVSRSRAHATHVVRGAVDRERLCVSDHACNLHTGTPACARCCRQPL
jgi:hypothetical protein